MINYLCSKASYLLNNGAVCVVQKSNTQQWQHFIVNWKSYQLQLPKVHAESRTQFKLRLINALTEILILLHKAHPWTQTYTQHTQTLDIHKQAHTLCCLNKSFQLLGMKGLFKLFLSFIFLIVSSGWSTLRKYPTSTIFTYFFKTKTFFKQ